MWHASSNDAQCQTDSCDVDTAKGLASWQHTLRLQGSLVRVRYIDTSSPCWKKKQKKFTSFSQPTRLITCAKHGRRVVSSRNPDSLRRSARLLYDQALTKLLGPARSGSLTEHGGKVRSTIRLSTKGFGVIRFGCDKVCTSLPHRSKGSTLKDKVHHTNNVIPICSWH